MNYQFKAGTYQFHKEPNFNYQMNRWLTFGNISEEEICKAAGRIKDLEDWKREFLRLARMANEEGDILKEACCYRAVDFFLNYSDPAKESNYDRLVSLFHKAYEPYFREGRILQRSVNFENISLPVWYAPPCKTDISKGTILMTGGFDCYKEELVPVMLYFADYGYHFYYFEGPGQGEVLMKQHYPMTHEWEKPVKAVLDGLDLKEVTLIGLSLGGYLAPRAAIHEKRIQRVIAWGTMYDFYKVVSTRRGMATALFIWSMVWLRLAAVMNAILAIKMKRDPYTFWGIDHGMHVMGVKTPYQYFRKLKSFSMRKIAGFVRQDFLLMTGTKDHFVDMDMYFQMERSLTQVRSFTGRIFTEREKAENHCQFGNLELALNTMTAWIETISTVNNDDNSELVQLKLNSKRFSKENTQWASDRDATPPEV